MAAGLFTCGPKRVILVKRRALYGMTALAAQRSRGGFLFLFLVTAAGADSKPCMDLAGRWAAGQPGTFRGVFRKPADGTRAALNSCLVHRRGNIPLVSRDYEYCEKAVGLPPPSLPA